VKESLTHGRVPHINIGFSPIKGRASFTPRDVTFDYSLHSLHFLVPISLVDEFLSEGKLAAMSTNALLKQVKEAIQKSRWDEVVEKSEEVIERDGKNYTA
jgi:hypothetical protein